jgi:crotonobetainyl-CoA hydratase
VDEHQHIDVAREGRITVVTLRRPEVRNALHPPANRELDRAFDDFAADPEQWVAILTGAGDQAFSAGNDLKYQAEHGGEAVFAEMKAVAGGFGGLTRRQGLWKPVIAAVNGAALGGGFEIVLACDLVVAVEDAVFGLPEPRVGFAAWGGGVHRLCRQLPYRVALGLILTGRTLGAREAAGLGLINEVVAGGRAALMERARGWAEAILECSPLAVRASKEAAVRGLDLPLGEALEARFAESRRLFRSADFVEGPRAFAEKRKPRWTGR